VGPVSDIYKRLTFSQLYDAVIKDKYYLYINKLSLQYAKRGAGQAGTRFFIYEKIPSLKYWNPDVTFESTKVVAEPKIPKVTITMLDGTNTEFNVEPTWKSSDILQKVLEHCPKEPPKLPVQKA